MLLATMIEHGLRPDKITYQVAISSCDGSEWKIASDLLSSMRSRGVDVDVIAFTHVIHVFGKGARWEEALQLLEQMREWGVMPDVRLWPNRIRSSPLEQTKHRPRA